MEGVPIEPALGAEEVSTTLTNEGIDVPAAPSIEDMPEGFTTMRNLAEEADPDVVDPAQVRDIARYLGLEPMGVRGTSNDLTQTFSPADAKTLTDFVLGQTRRNDEPTLGEADS